MYNVLSYRGWVDIKKPYVSFRTRHDRKWLQMRKCTLKREEVTSDKEYSVHLISMSWNLSKSALSLAETF
jgi:hypothetical protein